MNFSEWKKSELGLIPDKWKVVSLSEIAEIVSGGTPSTKREEYYGNDVAWITPKDLSGYEKKYIGKGERSISNLGLKNSSARLLPKNTILFSSRAPIGYVAIAENELATNQGFKSLICDIEKVDIQFMYYKMKTLKNSLESVAGGSTFKEVSGKVVKKFKIKLPTLVEQISIGKILSSLDKKIELNNEMNKTLEEMAQALFKRWFVDFEFPSVEGKPYKSSGGEMVESEMGMIPKGWNIKNLGQLGKIVTGKTPSTKDKENYGDDFNFITPADMNGNYYIINSQRKLSKQGYQKVSNLLIPENSVGVTCIGSNLGEVYLNAKESFTNQQINSLILYNHKYYPYVYIILKNMKNDFLNIAGGSAVPIINKTTFAGINIICPNDKLLNIYCEKVSCFFNKIKENLINNDALIQLRDSLLPKLMSGEIRVNNIEANL